MRNEDQGTPDNSDRMVDFLKEEYPLEKNHSTIIESFLEKIRAIHDAGKKQFLCPAEMITMINRNYGFCTWRQIPWGRMDEMREFIINNAKNCLKIIDPDLAHRLENYKPEDDVFLLKLEQWCPGMVNDLLHSTYKNKLKPRTDY